MTTLTRGKKGLLAAVLVTASGVVALVVAEIAVRMFSSVGYTTPEILRSQSLEYAPAVFARHVFPARRQEVLGDDGVKFVVNERGYRGPDFSSAKLHDAYRIMIYGGSAAFDQGAAEGQDWPRLVEEELHRLGFTQVEVINAAIPGHASYDSFGRFFAEGHLYSPDVVVLYNGWNDIKDFRLDKSLLRIQTPYTGHLDSYLHYQGWLDRMLSETSQLYVRLRGRYVLRGRQVGAEGIVPEGEIQSTFAATGTRQFKITAQMFVDLALNIGAIPVLVTQARLPTADSPESDRARIRYDYVGLSHEALVDAFAAIDDTLRSVAADKSVPIIDASVLSGRSDLLADHIHVTTAGSVALAALVADGLEKVMRAHGVEPGGS